MSVCRFMVDLVILRIGDVVVVVFSGGFDFIVLLYVIICVVIGWVVIVLYVYYGLLLQVDDWVSLCECMVGEFGVVFVCICLSGVFVCGDSVEVWVCVGCYCVLYDMIVVVGVDLLLLVYYCCDQVEIFVLQVLCGVGMGGLVGMLWLQWCDGVCWVWFWLDWLCDVIFVYVEQYGLCWIEDFSNSDDCFVCNCLCQILWLVFFGVELVLVQLVCWVVEVQVLVFEVVEQDLVGLVIDECFDFMVLVVLLFVCVSNVLCVWLLWYMIVLVSFVECLQFEWYFGVMLVWLVFGGDLYVYCDGLYWEFMSVVLLLYIVIDFDCFGVYLQLGWCGVWVVEIDELGIVLDCFVWFMQCSCVGVEQFQCVLILMLCSLKKVSQVVGLLLWWWVGLLFFDVVGCFVVVVGLGMDV